MFTVAYEFGLDVAVVIIVIANYIVNCELPFCNMYYQYVQGIKKNIKGNKVNYNTF